MKSSTPATHSFIDRTTDLKKALAAQEMFFEGTVVGTLGIRILAAAPGRSTAALKVERHTMHPGGQVHGGVIATLADSAAAWATLPTLEPGGNFSTIQFQVNFVRAVSEGELFAEATEIHLGSRTQVIDVRVTQGKDGPLVATVTVTQALLAPKNPVADK